MDAGRLRRQVLVKLFPVLMAHHHRRELAAEEFGQLGAGLVNGLLRGFVPAAGYGLASRLQAFRPGPGDNAVDIAGPDQAAEGRETVKLVALGFELGGGCRDDLRYFIRFSVDLLLLL